MENNELNAKTINNFYQAAIESDILDLDDVNSVYTPNFHLEQIEKVQALGNILISDENEDKRTRQNIFWDYLKFVKFKLELYKVHELSKT